jgi:selenocysteine lyase/cysteine desulfurase
MVAVRLPTEIDPESLKNYLYDNHNIEVLTHTWQELPFLRASFQAYNTASDLDALLEGLSAYLSKEEKYYETD